MEGIKPHRIPMKFQVYDPIFTLYCRNFMSKNAQIGSIIQS